MRLAPAVSVTASNAGVWRGLQVLLPAASAGVGVAWAALHLGASPVAALGWAACSAMAAAALVWRWLPAQPVHLRWTGSAWQVTPGGSDTFIDLQSAEVAIDFGTLLLLRLRPASAATGLTGSGTRLWIAVTRLEAGPDFRALCVALYAADLGREPPTGVADGLPAR